MGERCVITTQNDLDESGIGVYLHWMGSPEDVYPLLEYCRIRGFRCPEADSYGYARLVQVAANASGGEGLSVDVNKLDRLDMQNWNNGVYVVRGWKVEKRLYSEDAEVSIDGFYDSMRCLDEAQPSEQRIGSDMLRALWRRGLTLPEVAGDYYFRLSCNEC